MPDFKVQRGTSTLPAGVTTGTITAGVGCTAPASLTSAFIRITGARHNSHGVAGPFGGSPFLNGVWVSDPANLLTSITFQRGGSGTDSLSFDWEIVEYIGAAGGGNEFKVRLAQVVNPQGGGPFTYDSATTTVANDAKVLVYITGTGMHTNGGRGEAEESLFTAEWVPASAVARITRGDNTRQTALSIAVVEYTGANWTVQRVEHTHTGTSVATAAATIPDTTKAAIHVQHRVDVGAYSSTINAAAAGTRAWVSGTNQLSFQAQHIQTGTTHVAVAWVLTHTQTGGTGFTVGHYVGSWAGSTGAGVTKTETVAAVASLSEASIMGEGATHSLTNVEDQHHSQLGIRLTSTTGVLLSRGGETRQRSYRFQVVQWPTEAGGGGSAVLLAGEGTQTSDGTGALSVSKPLAGAGTVTSAGTGALQAAKTLASAGAQTSDGTGALSVSKPLAGAGTQTSAGSADLSVATSELLAGEGTATSAGSAALYVGRILAGEGVQTSAGSGSLAVPKALAGEGVQTSVGSGSLYVVNALYGDGSVLTAGEAALRIGALIVLETVGITVRLTRETRRVARLTRETRRVAQITRAITLDLEI